MKAFLLTTLFLFSLSSSLFAQHSGQAKFEDLKGIVAAFRCSGSFVSLGQKDYMPVFVLSAGHCIADDQNTILPNRAVVKLPIYDREEYVSYYTIYEPTKVMTMGSFMLSTIYYSTMTLEDVTLFQAGITLGDLKKMDTKVFELAGTLPKLGQTLRLTSGLWGKYQDCKVEKILKDNAEEKSLFGTSPEPLIQKNTILLDKSCTAQGGWSGSPLYDVKTNKIYGVASRVYTSKDGKSSRVIVSSLVEIKKCFDSSGNLAFNNANCKLPSY